ncbi:WXG100 family type VII secretion target [Xylanimonas allomyrinae]|uniref:ESAT-6-like protein n=1 Tax=Xylanimonas allomyrinae TaxID=2509459 RepID=A0A4P6EKK3_9MICO|nr:WXG100 family type VII secretion target [Xylanimonas allomyrinae]QAY62173.1 WXG100 family type VII secretion target [Xylanimonas allomyrinae]
MAGLGSFSVTPESVVTLSGQIRTGASGIRNELETLEQKVGRLRASWSGQAQEQYDIAQREWSKALGELQQLLERIASSTQQIADSYRSSDSSSARRFG